MRRLFNLLTCALLLAIFAAAVLALVLAWELNQVTDVSRAQPQVVALSELIKNGPPENRHIEVREFTYGKPLIEEKGGSWEAVWLPLYPAGSKVNDDTPEVVLRTTAVHNRTELESLLNTQPLRALVGSSISASRWNVEPATALYYDYPKLDPGRVMVLTDPALIISGHVLINEEQLFDRRLVLLSFATAVACFALTMAGVFVLYRTSGPSRPRRQRAPAANLSDHARLPEQMPVSTHNGCAEFAWKRALGYAGGIIMMALVGPGLLVFAFTFYQSGNTRAAALTGLLGVVITIAALGLAAVAAADVLFPIKRVALYRQGIRWQRGRRVYTALWSDIEAVYREATDIFRRGQHAGTIKLLTLCFHGGKRLKIAGDALTDYDYFADGVQSAHGGYALALKHREQTEFGEAEFGDISVRSDGVNVGPTFVPWGNLERYELSNGQLKLYSSKLASNKCRSFALKDIPNYAALLEMLRPRAMCY